MLTSQGILRNHYSLVFPAQLMSDRTKYKRKPSGKFKEKKRKQSHDSQSGPKTKKRKRQRGDSNEMPNSSSSEKLAKGLFAKPVIRQQWKGLQWCKLGLPASALPGGGGVHLEKLGGSVRPASQNPYPIYDQNLRYSLPYLWSDF